LEAVRIAGLALGLSLRIGISMQSELLSGDRATGASRLGKVLPTVALHSLARQRPASMPYS